MKTLYGKGHCPNEVAEVNGTATQNKQSGVRCTYWIDKNRTPCGGSHAWEDHKAALLKFAPQSVKGKGKSAEKGGKCKGKGKGKDQAHSLTEGQNEGQANAKSCPPSNTRACMSDVEINSRKPGVFGVVG